MTVVLTHPFCWPFVRRGSERLLHELASYLAGRGHSVTVVSSKPGPTEYSRAKNLLTVKVTQCSGWLSWLGISPERLFAVQCFRLLRRRRSDVVHCLSFYDACAARIAGWFDRRPYVYHITGIPTRRYFRRRPLEGLLFRFAVGGASEIVVPSEAARAAFERDFHRRAALIPPPCDLERFRPQGQKDLRRPSIVIAGSFTERRKGARVMMRAFVQVKTAVPSAVLVYAGAMPSELRAELLRDAPASIHDSVEFMGVGDVEDLPSLFHHAAVVVLPSIGEVFGMVLVEALASGTPVVGSRDGGIPEIVTPGVGVLFDPSPRDGEATNAEGLAAAIGEALRLHGAPDLQATCRERSKHYDWNAIGPAIEQLYTRSGSLEHTA